jgi:pimeloyl-ACP methyl ester carboxylesterase
MSTGASNRRVTTWHRRSAMQDDFMMLRLSFLNGIRTSRALFKGDRTRRIVLLAMLFAMPTLGQENAPKSTSASISSDFLGAYRVGTGETVAVSEIIVPDHHIYLVTDFSAGLRGRLEGEGQNEFHVVARGKIPSTDDPRVLFSHDSKGLPTITVRMNARERIGKKLDVRGSDVTFENGDVTLSGTLLLPPGKERSPAVVFVHGSGAATRYDYVEWAYYFAANGIAALIYDKRGAGKSTGDYRTATFSELADDANAGVKLLLSNREIDSARVGISGGSQGAWVAPMVAARNPAISYLIPTGGGPVTPAAQEGYRRTRLVKDAGYSEQDVATARDVIDTYFRYLMSNGSAESVRVSENWQRFHDKPWFQLLDMPTTDPTTAEWPDARKRFATELGFDAGPIYQQLRCPMLVIIGEQDQTFPVPALEKAFRNSVAKGLLTLWLLPNADHGLTIPSQSGGMSHQPVVLFEKMVAWIKAQKSARN